MNLSDELRQRPLCAVVPESEWAGIIARVATLEAQAMVEPPATVPLLWLQNFRGEKVPWEAYRVDAPDGHVDVVFSVLNTIIRTTQPKNAQGKMKSELGLREKLGGPLIYKRLQFRKEYWFAISFRLFDWKRDGHKCSIIDFHGSEDEKEKGIGRNASLGLHVGGDDIYQWRLWSKNPTQTANENRLECFRIPWVSDRWYRILYHVWFDCWPVEESGQGYTEIWLDGERVFQEVGPNAYNDVLGPYFKFGCYMPSWQENPPEITSGVEEHIIHWRDLVIGDARNKLEDFALKAE